MSGVGAVAPSAGAGSAAAALAAQTEQVGSGIAVSPQDGQLGIPHGAQGLQIARGAVASARAPKRPETRQRTPRTEPRRTVADPHAAAPILTNGPGGQTTAPSQAVHEGSPQVGQAGSGMGAAHEAHSGIAGAHVTHGASGRTGAHEVHSGIAGTLAAQTGAGISGAAQLRQAVRLISPLNKSQGRAAQTVHVSSATGAPQAAQAGAGAGSVDTPESALTRIPKRAAAARPRTNNRDLIR